MKKVICSLLAVGLVSAVITGCGCGREEEPVESEVVSENDADTEVLAENDTEEEPVTTTVAEEKEETETTTTTAETQPEEATTTTEAATTTTEAQTTTTVAETQPAETTTQTTATTAPPEETTTTTTTTVQAAAVYNTTDKSLPLGSTVYINGVAYTYGGTVPGTQIVVDNPAFYNHPEAAIMTCGQIDDKTYIVISEEEHILDIDYIWMTDCETRVNRIRTVAPSVDDAIYTTSN